MLVLSAFVSAQLGITDVTIGSDTQKRSNPYEDINQTLTSEFTLTNTGNETVTGLSFNRVGIDAKYAVRFINPPTEIAANSSLQVTIQGYIPIDLDAVDRNGNKIAVNIGSISVSGTKSISNTSTNTPTSNVFMRAINMLEINRMDIFWDGEDSRLDDGRLVRDIKPGDKIELRIVVENLFSGRRDEDFEIEDVDIFVEIDREFGRDDDYSIRYLYPRDREEITFEFDVRQDAREGTYPVVIKVVGIDENGAWHGEKWNVDLEIRRELRDIRIASAELIPNLISCERNIRLETNIKNIGRRSTSQGVLLVESDIFTERITSIRLDTDDNYRRTFMINVPEDTNPGVYLFTVKTFFDSSHYNNRDYSDVQDILLTVRECETVTPPPVEEPEDDEEVIIVQPPTTTPTPGIVYGQPPVKAEESFFETKAYIALLVVGALVGIALLFLAVAILLKK